ncbi:MAG TPA: FAD-binding oxidoreductase [Terriglobia bacterium]
MVARAQTISDSERTPSILSSAVGQGVPPVSGVMSAADKTGSAGIDRGVQQLSGWGRFPVEPCRLYEPADSADLAGLICSSRGECYTPRGLGRSYGDAALNRGAATVSLLRLNRILAFESATGILDCEAGVSLDQMIREALPRGFFLPVTPGTRQVTVGGAIAADVHGKNHHRAGSFSKGVLDLDLLTAEGERLQCSPEMHPEVFWATVGGVGLTGFIARARLQLRPVESAYLLVRVVRAANLETTLELLEEGDRQYEYSVAWTDCIARGAQLGRSLVMLGRHAAASEISKSVRGPLALRERERTNIPFPLPLTPLRTWTVGAFNAFYFHSKPAASERLVDLDRFFYPLDAVQHWNRLYGRRGFVQYQVVVPHTAARPVFTSLIQRIRESRRAAFLGVLKRFGEGGAGMLSFPMAGSTLALDLPFDRELPAFLRELDALVVDHGGRIYLAKDATLSAGSFARSYPRLDEFRAVQRRLDPRRRLSSSLARMLKFLDA